MLKISTVNMGVRELRRSAGLKGKFGGQRSNVNFTVTSQDKFLDSDANELQMDTQAEENTKTVI